MSTGDQVREDAEQLGRQPPQQGADREDVGRRKGWLSPEVAGEVLLLAIVACFFGYFLFQSLVEWPLGSGLMPIVAVAVGTPFWVRRARYLVGRRQEEKGRIMDVGLSIGADPRAETMRLARILGVFLALLLSVWLVGFHIALPLWVLFYLVYYGRMRPWWALLWAVGFEAFIYGVFDASIHVLWPQPLIFQWLDKAYFFGL